MNYTRILAGGIAAGVVINLSETIVWAWLLAERHQVRLSDLGLTEASWAMAGYVVTSFVLGLMLAWIYAAIRPRFGPGRATAIRAGVALWVVAWLIPVIWNAAGGLGMGIGPSALALGLEFAGVLLAAVTAGWIYREGDEGTLDDLP